MKALARISDVTRTHQANDCHAQAVSNIRALYAALQDAGYAAIVSAPAINQSGRGSLDAEPEEVDEGCQFQSCPPGSPPTGSNASDPNLNVCPLSSICLLHAKEAR